MDPSSRSISQTELLENLAWVQALARRLVSEPSAVEDVVQDTWVVALERPSRRTTGPGLRAWLARVTRTMARKYRGSEALLDRRLRAASGAEAEPSTFDVVTRVARQKRIIEAVMDLDEPARTTIFLRYVDGLNASAIAEQRGETPAAVRQRLSRALAKLRGRLEREFDDEEGGWIRALTPLVLAEGRNATTVGWARMLGGAIVTKTTITIGIGMAAVLGAIWLLRGNDSVAPAAPEVALPQVGMPLVAAGEGGSGEMTISAHEIADSAREVVPAQEILPGAIYALLDPEGQAVPDAKLFLCQDGKVLARGLTDEAGELATDVSGEESAQLLIQVPGVGPQLREVTLEPMRHVIQLEEGAVVSGWIVVDGKLPSERIPLRLRANHDLLPLQEELGLTLEEVGIDRMAALVSDTHAGDDGSFRFYGLPDDWSGSLDLPDDYHVADPLLAHAYARNILPVPAPVQGLRVEVVKRLALTGRIIDSTEGEPVAVPGAWIDPALEYPGIDPGRTYQGMMKTDEEGRFRIAPLASTIEGGSLVISPPDRKFYRVVPVEPRELQGDVDLGDLALRDLSDTRAIPLRVQDTDGVPIEGAVAATDETSPFSAPTGADGRTSLSIAVAGPSTFAVYARGYQAVEVPVPTVPPEDLVVTLPRGTLLEIEFHKPNGEIAPRLALSLLASRHPYRTKGSLRSFQAYRETGCSFPSVGQSGGPDVVVRLSVPREGRVVLNDLEPGLPLHLKIHGPYGRLVQEQDIAPLGPEERRSMEVVLIEAPRTLRGRILDETGAPLPQASFRVSWEEPDRRPTSGRTFSRGVDKDAGFEITDIYSDTVFFGADADDHVSFQDEEFAIPMDGSPVEIRLAPAHVLTVVIEDADGRGVPGKVYADLLSGSTLRGREVEGQVGTYILHGLPSGEVTIRIRVHGVFYVRRHDLLVPELRIEVPLLGTVEATISSVGDLELDSWCHVWLFPSGDSDLVPRFGMIDLGGDGPTIVPDVLPGAYNLTIRRFLQGDYPPDAWYEEIDASFFEELAPRVPLVIRPGETTKVEIHL